MCVLELTSERLYTIAIKIPYEQIGNVVKACKMCPGVTKTDKLIVAYTSGACKRTAIPSQNRVCDRSDTHFFENIQNSCDISSVCVVRLHHSGLHGCKKTGLRCQQAATLLFQLLFILDVLPCGAILPTEGL